MARKNKDRITTVSFSEGVDISYPEALRNQLQRNLNQFYIQIVPPFDKFDDYIFLFPSSIDVYGDRPTTGSKIADRYMISHAHRNFVLYKNTWHLPKTLFKAIPDNYCNSESLVVRYLANKYNLKAIFQIPYFYFDLTSAQQTNFKQKAVQPIRDLFSEFNVLTPDDRGKGSLEARIIREERKQFCIDIMDTINNKRSLKIAYIHNKWAEYLRKRFPNDSEKYDRYIGSAATLRKALKNISLNK